MSVAFGALHVTVSNCVVCSRWKLPLFLSAKAPATQATLTTTRKRKSESPSLRSAQRSSQSSRFQPRVSERKRETGILKVKGGLETGSTRVD